LPRHPPNAGLKDLHRETLAYFFRAVDILVQAGLTTDEVKERHQD
jgi:hypothetical protein